MGVIANLHANRRVTKPDGAVRNLGLDLVEGLPVANR